MINLKNYIIESILDIEDNIDNIDESIKDQIKQFLKDNFTNASKCKISKKPNKDGKFEVLSNGDIEVKNQQITSLTNGVFIWNNIGRNFNCWGCKSLISLEGAPKKVGGDFICYNCKSLTSLEGAPKEVKGDFICYNCKSLTSLEGAPKVVGGDFNCFGCHSLKSLEGIPKEVGRTFCCVDCGSKFTQEDVKKISNVKGTIDV